MMGSVSGLSMASRGSRMSVARSVMSVATVTTTVQRKTGLKLPILDYAGFTDVQRGSVLSALYTMVQGLFLIVTGLFEIYALSLAIPGSAHYGYYLFSFDFVYVGNPHVRNSLVLFAALCSLCGLILIVASVMLMQGLRRENEARMEAWLWSVGVVTIFRTLVVIYSSIVNDLVFGYHIVILLFGLLLLAGNIYAWLVVHSFYHELCEVTRLEDVARVKIETMSTFGSRPTTPGQHSTISSYAP